MTQTQPAQQQQSYRWVILVAMCVIGFMTIGTRSTVSSFLKTIIADLGTNRETISFIVADNIWLSGLLQPFAGYIMDRFGARGLFTASVALYGRGHWAHWSYATVSGTCSSVYGVLVGAASAGASMSLTNALLAQWFKDWRALAMSINNAGGAVGTLFVVGTMSPWLLSSFGWRLSHIYLGVADPAAGNAPGPVFPSAPLPLLKTVRTPAGCSTPCSGPLETQSWAEALTQCAALAAQRQLLRLWHDGESVYHSLHSLCHRPWVYALKPLLRAFGAHGHVQCGRLAALWRGL